MGQTLTTISSLWSESFPPAPRFTIDDGIPDLTGKVVLVTGGYAGVGKETVYALLRKNARVYVAGRSQSKAQAAIDELKERTGGKEAAFIELDLASLSSVKKAAAEFQSKETQLHILFNNGGVMNPPVGQLTSDGYDLQFGTNCLGHWYLTQLLLPTLLETAKTAEPEHSVRVITTASSTHLFAPANGIKWDTLGKGEDVQKARRKLGTQMLYAQSKFGNVVAALELARRYGDQGIVSMALNPGNIKTELQRHMSGLQARFVNMILHPVPLGALTQLWGGTSPETATYNGKYLIPWARLGEPRKDALDRGTGERLWAWLEEQVKDLAD